jgi:hypothetical protein
VGDGIENNQGTNPNDPNGSAPPPGGTVPVHVTFGDHSDSHSEKYRLILTPLEGDPGGLRQRTNRDYGQVQTDTFHLPKGAKYKVELFYKATSPTYRNLPRPDYDYTLQIASTGADAAAAAVVTDPQGIFAQAKDATLYIAWLRSVTVAEIPDDRARKRLGAGEGAYLTLRPLTLPAVTWALTGTANTSTLEPTPTGITGQFIAGERACAPTVQVTINGIAVRIDFTVVQPTGVAMEPEPGTGTRSAIRRFYRPRLF